MRKIACCITTLPILTLIILINSCTPPPQAVNRITVESGQIPPDMQKEDFTLIGILQGRKSYDKYVEKAFENYTGKYVIAKQEELQTTYADINKYRYIMDCNENINGNVPSSSGGITTTTGYRYFILDRKYDKKYYRKSGSSFFALEMKTYVMAIDNARKK